MVGQLPDQTSQHVKYELGCKYSHPGLALYFYKPCKTNRSTEFFKSITRQIEIATLALAFFPIQCRLTQPYHANPF